MLLGPRARLCASGAPAGSVPAASNLQKREAPPKVKLVVHTEWEPGHSTGRERGWSPASPGKAPGISRTPARRSGFGWLRQTHVRALGLRAQTWDRGPGTES